MNKKRWRAKCGKTYWFVNGALLLVNTTDFRDSRSNAHYRCGNYFETRKQAAAIAKRMKQMLQGKTCKWKKSGKPFWDTIDHYTTGCKKEINANKKYFDDGKIKFCPYCGLQIEVAK